MKTFFLFVAIIATSFTAKSQGNLQFNQVKLVNTNSTVPTGKVWKVESVLNGDSASWTSSTINECVMSIKINTSEICLLKSRRYAVGTGNTSSAAASESSFNCSNLPIWLPAGSLVDLGFNSKFISIIEYNIVP